MTEDPAHDGSKPGGLPARRDAQNAAPDARPARRKRRRRPRDENGRPLASSERPERRRRRRLRPADEAGAGASPETDRSARSSERPERRRRRRRRAPDEPLAPVQAQPARQTLRSPSSSSGPLTEPAAPAQLPVAAPLPRDSGAQQTRKPRVRTPYPMGRDDTSRAAEPAPSDAPEMLDAHVDASVSPRMTALFGGLFGAATIASMVALLIQVFPVENQRARAEQMLQTTAPSLSATPASAPERPKRVRNILPGPWRVAALKGTHRMVKGTTKRRSFITALGDAGVPTGETYRILKAMDGVRKFDRTGKNDQFVVALDRATKKVMGFEYIVNDAEIYQAKTGDDGLLHGEKLDMKVREEEFATSFYIGKDLVKSYRAVGLEPGLLSVLNKAYNGRTSTEAFKEGGVVKIVVVERTALGRFAKYARIKAVEYRAPDPSEKPIRAYWFDNANGYVDEDGRRPSHKGWRTPVPGAPITSHFNPKRMHPVLNKVMPHNGTDFGAPAGTPVYAAFRGEVTWVGMRGASGNLVLVQHTGGIQTGYAHLSRFAKGIKHGDRVATRQLIGYIGSTGRSTGPHLHLSAKKDGKYFDSRDLKMDAVRLLPVSERGLFMQQKQAFDAALDALPLPAPPPPEPEPPEPDDALDPAADDEDNSPPPNPKKSDPSNDESDDGPGGPTGDEGSDLLGEDLSGDME